ncbi:MAG: transglycosylase domain-containing protein [Candidatus Hydrogenedentes bacterium]|nr:transglycosylase domain-containing protein [Candidatus Hydrogenedentota bacterium]
MTLQKSSCDDLRQSVSLDELTRNVLKTTGLLSDRLLGRAVRASARHLALELQLPPHFVELLLLIEDKRFMFHPGVDLIAVPRALLFNFGTAAKRPHGASTITQQVYSSAARRNGRYRSTIRFKARQSLWAIWHTILCSKARILRLYLDTVYFGRSGYGLLPAARRYCHRLPSELGIAESFFLVERIARPNRVDPIRVAMLSMRAPIAATLRKDTNVVRELAALYESHFGFGERIRLCLEKSLTK